MCLAEAGIKALAMGKFDTIKEFLTPAKPTPDEPIVSRGVEWDALGVMRSCLFCDFAAQKKDKNLLFEDELVVAFSPLHESAKQHIIIVPKKHVSTIGDLIADDIAVLDRMRSVAEDVLKLKDGSSSAQYSFHIPPWNSIGEPVRCCADC